MAFGIDEGLGYREQAKAYSAKIELFKQELDVLSKQLSAKRIEMSTLAKKTLADYESSIPKLEMQLADKNKHLSIIDKKISDRIEQYNQQLTSCKDHYEKLEEDLKNSYAQRVIHLEHARDKIEDMHKREQEKINAKEKDLIIREVAVQESFEMNMDRKSSLDDLEKRLKIVRDTFEVEVAGARKDIFSQKEVLEDMKRGVQARAGELNELLKQAKAAKDNADAITARISEVENRENNLVVREEAIKRRSQELDEYHVKLVADNRKIDLRLEDLGKLEIKLQEREKNIKLAEEKIAKGNNGKIA